MPCLRLVCPEVVQVVISLAVTCACSGSVSSVTFVVTALCRVADKGLSLMPSVRRVCITSDESRHSLNFQSRSNVSLWRTSADVAVRTVNIPIDSNNNDFLFMSYLGFVDCGYTLCV